MPKPNIDIVKKNIYNITNLIIVTARVSNSVTILNENGDCVNKSTKKKTKKKRAENIRMPQRCLQQIWEHSASGGELQKYFFKSCSN